MLGLIGLMQGEMLFLLLCCLVLGAAIACRPLARRNLTGVSVERRLPHRTRVGLPTPMRYEVRTERSREAVGLEVEDRTGRGVKPNRLVVELPVVAPDAEARCVTHVQFQRRGLYVVERVTLSSRFPLGLVRAEVGLEAPARALVHPAEGRISARLRDRLRGLSRRASREQTLWRGDDLLYGVREYREGDDPRRIHWRTTARRGELTITEWRAQEEGEVVLVLGRATGAGADMEQRFERAVSVTATIWRVLCRQGIPARLVLDEGGVPIATRDRTALIEGLDALSRVKAQRRHPLRGLTQSARTRRARTVVYVGTGRQSRVSALLARAAGRRGDVLALRVDRASIRQWVRGIA
jgi:uncharacterized protein (DUF58 family)